MYLRSLFPVQETRLTPANRRLSHMRFTAEVGVHACVIRTDPVTVIAEFSENGCGPQMPTGPGEWRVPVHIFRVDNCTRVNQGLNGFFLSKRGGAVQWCFAFGADVSHEAAGFHAGLRSAIGIRPVR